MSEMSTTMTHAGRTVIREAPVTNAERMYALDEAWNARDWDTFDFFHDPGDSVIYWPDRQDSPTHGGPDHRDDPTWFCTAFPDNRVHHPYHILFGEGDFTCFVTRFTGTFTVPLEMPDGTVVQPTGKAFDVIFSTTAHWRNGKIVEGYLLYDTGTFLRQGGLV